MPFPLEFVKNFEAGQTSQENIHQGTGVQLVHYTLLFILNQLCTLTHWPRVRGGRHCLKSHCKAQRFHLGFCSLHSDWPRAERSKGLASFFLEKSTPTKLIVGKEIVEACSTSVNSSIFERRVETLPQTSRF